MAKLKKPDEEKIRRAKSDTSKFSHFNEAGQKRVSVRQD